ncbi:MAG: signal peptidase II [Ignavibacteria bacterium]|nr:signal peptidase II [Ignavibacteria bacterium]
MNQTSTSIRRFFFLSIGLIILDQVTKLCVKGFTLFGIQHEGMYLGESHPLLGEIVRLTFVENPGMAFGVSFGWGKVFLTLFSLIAGIGLAWYLSKLRHHSVWVQLGISLLLAGAIGNFIDRAFYGVLYNEGALFYGLVVDFIQVDIPDVNWFGQVYTHWPVFNVADSCVSCGMVLLFIMNKKIPMLNQLDPVVVPTDENPPHESGETDNTPPEQTT